MGTAAVMYRYSCSCCDVHAAEPPPPASQLVLCKLRGASGPLTRWCRITFANRMPLKRKKVHHTLEEGEGENGGESEIGSEGAGETDK